MEDQQRRANRCRNQRSDHRYKELLTGVLRTSFDDRMATHQVKFDRWDAKAERSRHDHVAKFVQEDRRIQDEDEKHCEYDAVAFVKNCELGAKHEDQ